MSASQPEPTNAWHPSYWANRLSLSAAQKDTVRQALAESAGLNLRHHKDEETAETMLQSVLALIGSYTGLQTVLENRPRESSRLGELRKLERAMNKVRTQLDDLSDAAKLDIWAGQRTLFLEQHSPSHLNVLAGKDQFEEGLETLAAQLDAILVIVQQAIPEVTPTASGRRGTAPKSLQVLIGQLLNVFQTCAAAGHEASQDDQRQFLRTALKVAGIRPPRDLAHYLPRH